MRKENDIEKFNSRENPDIEKLQGDAQKNILLYASVDADEELIKLAEERLDTRAVKEILKVMDEASMKNDGILDKVSARNANTLDDVYVKNSGTNEAENNIPVVRVDSDGISLVAGGQKIRGDFSREIKRVTNESRLNGELLIKAAKVKGGKGTHELTAIDATAGLGEDALLLAAYGYRVTMFERDPVIGLLLYDALRRAKEISELKEIVSRMKLVMEDSIAAMQKPANVDATWDDHGQCDKAETAQESGPVVANPDIILLDPMFPERKKSGLIKKKFQVLHYLEKPCEDEAELLAAAKAAHPKKIIIKRPAKGPFLADEKPSYSVKGDSIRYDCIVLN